MLCIRWFKGWFIYNTLYIRLKLISWQISWTYSWNDALLSFCHSRRGLCVVGCASCTCDWSIIRTCSYNYLYIDQQTRAIKINVGSKVIVPVNTKHFINHLYNVGPTSTTFVQYCINVIQMYGVYYVPPSQWSDQLKIASTGLESWTNTDPTPANSNTRDVYQMLC